MRCIVIGDQCGVHARETPQVKRLMPCRHMVKSSNIAARSPKYLIMIIGKAKIASGCRDSALWLIDQTGYRIFLDETELKIKIHGRN
jgi:hypothetical protein